MLLVIRLSLPLPSPIVVPPAKVQGTFLLFAYKPASNSRSLFCYGPFAKDTHGSDSKILETLRRKGLKAVVTTWMGGAGGQLGTKVTLHRWG